MKLRAGKKDENRQETKVEADTSLKPASKKHFIHDINFHPYFSPYYLVYFRLRIDKCSPQRTEFQTALTLHVLKGDRLPSYL